MKVVFRTIGSKIYAVNIEGDMLISELKERLSQQNNLPRDQINLTYQSKPLADQELFSSIQYNEGSYIILYLRVPKKNNTVQKPQQVEKADLRAPLIHHIEQAPEPQKTLISAPLPTLNMQRFNDPPDIQRRVQQLTLLGYGDGDSLDALRAASYNVNEAANYLLNNYIPELHETQRQETLEQSSNFSEDEFDHEEGLTVSEITAKIKETPNGLKRFFDELGQANPELLPMIHTNPAAVLISVGLDPNEFDLSPFLPKSEYEKLMDQFTEGEQATIHRLEKLGFDTMTIIQVFVACEKNEQATSQCLVSMQ